MVLSCWRVANHLIIRGANLWFFGGYCYDLQLEEYAVSNLERLGLSSLESILTHLPTEIIPLSDVKDLQRNVD